MIAINFMDILPQTVIETTGEGRIRYINQAGCDILGYSREELKQMLVFDLIAPQDKSTVIERFRKKINRELIDPSTYVMKRKNGALFPAIVYSSPVDHRDGTRGLVSIVADATIQQQTEKRLLESEERFHALFEIIPDAVFIKNRDLRYTDVNPSMAKFVGIPRERMIGATDKELFEESAARSIQDNDRKVLKGETTESENIIFVNQQKKIFEVTKTPMRNHQGEITGICGIARDVTERRVITQQLEAERRRLRGIIEFLPDVTFVIDNSNQVIAWNRATEHMTGIPKEDILGKTNYAEAFYGHTRPLLVDAVQDENLDIKDQYEHVRWTGSSVCAENLVKKGDGEEAKYLWGISSPLFDSNGRKIGAIETIRDLTERKRLENQFIHSQKMEAVGNLAAGIAHDFNNILSVIMGYGTFLKMKIGSDPASLVSYADQIIAASERASRLTASLLAYSQKQMMHMKPVDLKNLIKEAKKLLSHLLTEDIEFTIDLPKKEIIIMADRVQIEQVLMNLISNARDAMSNKGRVAITLYDITIDTAFIRSNGFGKEGVYALIKCSDTGCGMDKTVLDRVYEPFFTTKEVGKGTGLGLSTVLGIVEQHGGYIKIDSQPGIGTTFFIYIPVIEGTEEPEGVKKEQSEPPQGTETILLAEDDTKLRSLMRDVLQSHGYRVIDARDGNEALNLFMDNTNTIDLLFLDVVMPGKNGKEVYRGARAIRPGIKVLFYSGYNDDVITDKTSFSTPVLCLKKPLELDKALEAVRNVLDGVDVKET